MKKRTLIPTLFLSLSMLLNPSCCLLRAGRTADDLSSKGPRTAREQQALIYEYLKGFPDRTQASLAVIENGTVRFYGVIREADTLLAHANQDRVFEIGSLSKVFTATLLAGFIIQETIDPDDRINDFLAFTLKDHTEITFRQLANHTSGLPRMPDNFALSAMMNPGNPYQNYDEEKLEKYLTESLRLSFEPGEKSEYSNLGAGLLAYALERYSGKTYGELLESLVFSRYGMTRSTTRREVFKDNLVTGLSAAGEETPNWDFSALIGAGGILSTAEDLSKFALAHFEDSNGELALTRTKTFSDSAGPDMGLGWYIIQTESGDTWYWHNGGTGGYRSSMALDVHSKNGIIILSNVSAYHRDSQKIDTLCFALMNILQRE